jgi:hypothetical protein
MDFAIGAAMWFAARGEGTLWEGMQQEEMQGQDQGQGHEQGQGQEQSAEQMVSAGQGSGHRDACNGKSGEPAGREMQGEEAKTEEAKTEEILLFSRQLVSLLSRAEYRQQGLPLALLPAAYTAQYQRKIPDPRQYGCGK